MTVWRVRWGSREAIVEGDEEATRGSLVAAIQAAGHPGGDVIVDGERWSADDTQLLSAGDAGLRHGSLIATSDRVQEPARDDLVPGRYLVVIGGPAAGTARRVDPGHPIVVGRGSLTDRPHDTVDLPIDDPLLSARHFAVNVAPDGSMTVADLGSRNGTCADGDPLSADAVAALEPGGAIHAGASLFTMVDWSRDDRATLLGPTATGVHVHRQFREATPPLPDPPAPPRPPRSADGTGGASWWRALVPLVTAAGMAAMTGRWWFLALGALAPVVYAADAWHRRRRTRRARAAEQAEHTEATARYTTALRAHRTAEARRARIADAGGGAAAALARFGHRRVWERRPTDADFGSVTLGFAALPSASDPSGTGSGTSALWQAPLRIDLRADAPLAITGPRARAVATARGLVIDATFHHSPGDVAVWVLADDTHADEWDFAVWLPHAFLPDGGARIATTATARSALVVALRGLIDARRERAATTRDDPTLPLQIVVVDGVTGLDGADLTEILRRGPEVGVVGIVVDPDVVPEGVRAEFRLGRFDDECSYRSATRPRVDGVVVAEVPVTVARDAALALAPLDAFGSSAPSEFARLHFTDLVGFADRTPEEQAAFWREHSPCTDVPVGVTLDGAPFRIDVVTGGPHGLIGGMTRSGKTEFLKTWLTSLAMHNHPDDLAIAIVDFKGGVDHRTTATLPHVIALATNQDIDRFERTIALLTAEHERRQRIFLDVAGVATLEGYRTARTARPDLPPMPRLLIVVDEFAELLETPEGKAQLGRLESVTRIGAGLGIHLVLVTQTFNAALPPTIDGQAGLRVCFKVQNGENSKIVLKSAVAADIAASTKGRAFVRCQGADLVEFQTARIGNEARRSPGARRGGSAVTVRIVTPDTRVRPPAPPDEREVPNEAQDLFRVVGVLRRAADIAGHAAPAVPWPGELAESISLDELPAPGASGVVIGIADDPARQRAVTLRHHLTDPVVAYVGASGSGHHSALVTTVLQVAQRHGPDGVQMYAIDLIGAGLEPLDRLPHVGTIATRDDATALRILGFLTTEAVRRRGSGPSATDPHIVMFVVGLDRAFLHGEGVASPVLGPLTTLVNEVAGTGIQVVFSGTHPMLGNRIGSTASRRLVFGANDTSEYPAFVPRAARTRLAVPRRCLDSATGLLAQVAAPPSPDELAARADRIARGHAAPERPPRRFVRAPWPLCLDGVGNGAPLLAPPGVEFGLPLGVQPDTGDVMWLDPAEDGTAHRIIGPSKSGRSNALSALALLARRSGWGTLVAAGSRRSPLLTVPELADSVVEAESLPSLLAEPRARATLVVVDDAHRLGDEFKWRAIGAAMVEAPVWAPVVVFVAGATEALTRPTGVARSLAAPGGFALMCSRSRDADGIGIRQIDDEWLVRPLPGIGVASIAGEPRQIQFPLVT